MSRHGTVLPPVIYLPPAQPHLDSHAEEPRYTDSARVTHTRGAETKLSVLAGHVVRNLRKRTDINKPAEQALPENNDTDNVVAGDEVEHGVEGKQSEVRDLQQRGEVEVVNADKGCRGARDEDADLVDGVIGAVERAVLGEGARVEWEEQGWRYALVNCIFGNVDEEEGQHATAH
jgi:hypothetical protein